MPQIQRLDSAGSVAGEKRATTDRTSRGLRVEYDRILGSGFGVRYTMSLLLDEHILQAEH